MGLSSVIKNVVAVTNALRGEAYLPPPGAFWDGPDDIWPEEEDVEDSNIDVVVTEEWGLHLPGGEIAWNSWQGVPFDNPLDRLHMVARIKKTAQDTGWLEEDFTSGYSWVTRKAVSHVTYTLGDTHMLEDPKVSELGTPVEVSDNDQQEKETT